MMRIIRILVKHEIHNFILVRHMIGKLVRKRILVDFVVNPELALLVLYVADILFCISESLFCIFQPLEDSIIADLSPSLGLDPIIHS